MRIRYTRFLMNGRSSHGHHYHYHHHDDDVDDDDDSGLHISTRRHTTHLVHPPPYAYVITPDSTPLHRLHTHTRAHTLTHTLTHTHTHTHRIRYSSNSTPLLYSYTIVVVIESDSFNRCLGISFQLFTISIGNTHVNMIIY